MAVSKCILYAYIHTHTGTHIISYHFERKRIIHRRLHVHTYRYVSTGMYSYVYWKRDPFDGRTADGKRKEGKRRAMREKTRSNPANNAGTWNGCFTGWSYWPGRSSGQVSSIVRTFFLGLPWWWVMTRLKKRNIRNGDHNQQLKCYPTK